MRLKIKFLVFFSFEGWNISLALPVKLSSRVTMCYRLVRLEMTFVVCLRQQGTLYSAFAPLLGIWMGKIIKITKRAIRIMRNSKHNAHMDPLFETLKLQKIKDKDVQCMIFWYRFVNNNVPSYLASMCRYNYELYDIQIRSHVRLHLYPFRTYNDHNAQGHCIPEWLCKFPTAVVEKFCTQSEH